MYEFFLAVIHFVESLGYIGIFIMTFIEATLIPIPSEITLIPAGYLVAKGHFNLALLILVSTLGTLGGALSSYYIAMKFGREMIMKYGKYIGLDANKLVKMEAFFQKHGAISAFTGRMLPGLKHFIAFPAGLGKMDLKLFTLYSTAGSILWVSMIIIVGYFIGDNEDLIYKYLHYLNIGIIAVILIIVAFYGFKIYKRRKMAE